MTALAIAAAGGTGALCRYLVTVGSTRPRLGTWIVNIVGCAAMGALIGLGRHEAVWTAGFLGGFTTFSTAAVESADLVEDDRLGRGIVHATVMFAGCTTAAVLAHSAAVGLG